MRPIALPLKGRLFLLSVPWIFALLVIGALATKALVDGAYQDHMDRIKRTAYAAYKIVDYFGEQEKLGKLSREDAQKKAIELVSTFGFSDEEYIWINTYKGILVSHPNQKIIGEDMWDAMDPNGKALFQEFSRIAQTSGADFVSYYWPRPGYDKPVKKLSLVQGYAPWEWVIGTGLYVDDIEAAEYDEIIYMVGILIASLAVSIWFSIMLSRQISAPIAKMTDAMRRLSCRDYSSLPPISVRNDEIGEMSAAFMAIRNHALDNDRILIEKEALIERLTDLK